MSVQHHFAARELAWRKLMSDQRKSALDVLRMRWPGDDFYTTRAEGDLSIRTCPCLCCADHWITEVWASRDVYDRIHGIDVLGRSLFEEVFRGDCRTHPWMSPDRVSAESMHDKIVDAIDKAIMARVNSYLEMSK